MSLDDLQAQLRGTLDQQFAALKQKYDESIADARRQAAADAEREAAVQLAALKQKYDESITDARRQAAADAERGAAVQLERARAEFEVARAEWETQLHAAATAARAEGEQLAADAAQQERDAQERKLEEAVDHAVAAARRTAELELESERRRAHKELEAVHQKSVTETAAARAAAEAERQRARTELDSLQQRMQTEIAAARQAAQVSAQPAAPPLATAAVPAAAFERLLAATRHIDGARTLSQALESLLAHAGAVAGRAAIFLINADRLKAWKTSGIPDVDAQTVESSIGGKDLLARAIQSGQATASGAPPFARLPAGRAGLAVPLMIGGRAVAVLYADSGTNPPPAGSAEIVEVLVRHASAIVALRTAMRTLEVLGGGRPDGPAPGNGGDVDDDQGARRYARLLVSEIKLYNEAAVRAGRQQRDLLQRLRGEIDHAQQLYEQRVPSAVGGRHVYFQQELVQTLADGDPALLGNQ